MRFGTLGGEEGVSKAQRTKARGCAIRRGRGAYIVRHSREQSLVEYDTLLGIIHIWKKEFCESISSIRSLLPFHHEDGKYLPRILSCLLVSRVSRRSWVLLLDLPNN